MNGYVFGSWRIEAVADVEHAIRNDYKADINNPWVREAIPQQTDGGAFPSAPKGEENRLENPLQK
jgi:hypothetical protein